MSRSNVKIWICQTNYYFLLKTCYLTYALHFNHDCELNLIFQGPSDELSAKFADLTPNTIYIVHISARLGDRSIGEVKLEGKTSKEMK